MKKIDDLSGFKHSTVVDARLAGLNISETCGDFYIQPSPGFRENSLTKKISTETKALLL